MNKQYITKILDWLKSQTDGSTYKFDMAYWRDDSECGTMLCMGGAHIQFNRPDIKYSIPYEAYLNEDGEDVSCSEIASSDLGVVSWLFYVGQWPHWAQEIYTEKGELPAAIALLEGLLDGTVSPETLEKV